MNTTQRESRPFDANPADYARGKVSNGIAWVMPWLFLSLRRALIPTVCLVVLAALFYLVPQSRDILAGFVEPVPSTSSRELFARWDPSTLTCYLVNSVLLALTVWYTSRLLCTVEAWLGMPIVWVLREFNQRQAHLAHLESPRDETRVRHAIKWLPRSYGVAALASAMGAFIYANLAPRTQGAGGIGYVALALAGPLLFVSGAMRNGKAGKGCASIVKPLAMALSVVFFTISCWALLTRSAVPHVGYLSIGCTLLPALLLWFLIARRAIVKKLFSTELPEPNDELSFHDVFAQVSVFVALGGIALVCISLCGFFKPLTSIIRHIGSAATVMLFLAAAVLLLSGIQLCLRRVSRAVPGFTSFMAIFAFGLLSYCGHEPLDRKSLAAIDVSSTPRPVSTTATAALPGVIINAYGGGLRAAIYTAQVLALADDASCGEFGNHIRALSGVSGGSLGIAVYLTARQELQPLGLWNEKNCKPGKVTDTPLTRVVTQALVQDHLSPAIAELLSFDLLPFSSPQRGIAMLNSWNDALIDALKASPPAKAINGYEPQATLAMRLWQLDGEISPAPHVYFNTTDADTGERTWFSNMPRGQQTSADVPKNYDISLMTLGDAVLHSARFPIISPAGAFPSSEESAPHRFVDGGYADNSGAQTLVDRMFEIDPDKKARPVSLDINGNPPDAREATLMTFVCPPKQTEQKLGQDDRAAPAASQKSSRVPTSILALLSARSAHAFDSAYQLSCKTGGCSGGTAWQHCLHPVQMNPESSYGIKDKNDPRCEYVSKAPIAPLGWYTSQGSSTLIAQSARAAVDRVCQSAGIGACLLPTSLNLNP